MFFLSCKVFTFINTACSRLQLAKPRTSPAAWVGAGGWCPQSCRRGTTPRCTATRCGCSRGRATTTCAACSASTCSAAGVGSGPASTTAEPCMQAPCGYRCSQRSVTPRRQPCPALTSTSLRKHASIGRTPKRLKDLALPSAVSVVLPNAWRGSCMRHGEGRLGEFGVLQKPLGIAWMSTRSWAGTREAGTLVF